MIFLYIGIPNESMEITFRDRSSEIFRPLIGTKKPFIEPLIASHSLTHEKE